MQQRASCWAILALRIFEGPPRTARATGLNRTSYALSPAWPGVLAAMISLACPAIAGAQPRAPLRQVNAIPLLAVAGRIDHLAVDLAGKRVFLAALEKNEVEVVDISSGAVTQTIVGLEKPQGLLFVDKLHRLIVASGKDGTVKTFEGSSLSPSTTVTVSLGADAIGYDPKANEIYVGSGGADAGEEHGDLTIFDAGTLRRKAALTADAHAGGSVPDGPTTRMFVLVPEKSEVMVVDRSTHTVKTTWTIAGIQKDVAIALDESRHRLFLGVRNPPSIVVLNSDTGVKVADVATVGTLDGLWFDAATRRIYTTGGEGFLDVTQQIDPDHYRQIAHIETGPVARTSIFVPQWKRLFVAVPRNKDRSAELRVFEVVR